MTAAEICKEMYNLKKSINYGVKVIKEEVKKHIDDLANLDISALYDEYDVNANEKKYKMLSKELRIEQNREIKVGDGATICLWSDRHACTVVKRTAKTITVQYDTAILDKNFKPEWIEGGFAGHCTNQDEQRYTYERNTNGAKETFYWSEANGRWQNGDIKLIRGRHEFYDYNF